MVRVVKPDSIASDEADGRVRAEVRVRELLQEIFSDMNVLLTIYLSDRPMRGVCENWFRFLCVGPCTAWSRPVIQLWYFANGLGRPVCGSFPRCGGSFRRSRSCFPGRRQIKGGGGGVPLIPRLFGRSGASGSWVMSWGFYKLHNIDSVYEHTVGFQPRRARLIDQGAL